MVLLIAFLIGVGIAGVPLLVQLRQLRSNFHACRHSATHDALTGIANRAGFWEQTNDLLVRADGSVVVAIIDLDNFKPVNDLYGHTAGDEVLTVIAARLQGCFFEVQYVVGRLGGDEFAAAFTVLSNVDTDVWLDSFLTWISNRIAEPIHVADQRVEVSASIGAVVSKAGETWSLSSLLHTADIAMYYAKTNKSGVGISCDIRPLSPGRPPSRIRDSGRFL